MIYTPRSLGLFLVLLRLERLGRDPLYADTELHAIV